MNVDDKRIRRALIREAERRGAMLAKAAGESQIGASAAEALAFTELAGTVWTNAVAGERWAVEFIRDSIDGKPAQAITGDPDKPLHIINKIERLIVRPENRDG